MTSTEPQRRPRLLFLCQTLPYPADGGVHIRTYNILRLLARRFEITALCFYRRASRPTRSDVDASVEGLSKLARVHAFPIPQDHSGARFVWDHLRSLVRGRVYTRYAYDSRAFGEALRRLLTAERFDLVHVDSLDLACYFRHLGDLPVICTHHNVESDLLSRRAATERFPMDAYLRRQASLMAAEERRECPRVDLNVAVSADDAARLRAIAPGASVDVVPNGVDTAYFANQRAVAPEALGERGSTDLVFVGGYTWYPNRDALEHFAVSILPVIRGTLPDVSVTWVGDAPAKVRTEYARRYGIRLTGYVHDVRPYIKAAACYVVPLRVGGGTRLKILDAWSMARAVVSTSAGCEGLDAVDGENILIRDTPESFAAAVLSVLRDADLRVELERSARATVERTYDWDVIGQSMLERYAAVAGLTARRAGAHGSPDLETVPTRL